MEGGNKHANLVRQTDEYGNPLHTTLDNGRQGLGTNVGHATGGAGCHYDFRDTTGVGLGFGVSGTNLNQPDITPVGGGGIVKETGGRDASLHGLSDEHGEKGKTEKIKS
ncbi:hypothetical protein HanXRQr2_Chr09g0393301 [Helianthus annuus]|uniref:Dehydrin n=1 Tax=Helianthus annuus TaxID=4232 RepID=A0A9K3N971_HELAN|nr:hypothetical protein HanXRQr2_Chr09g0393301 [Helianthus annuus]KAJ0534834.1 hypothetical protein HanIR_Chr09g0424151 [Helianthus annuus]